MDYRSVRVYPVPWLGSRRATAHILLVLNHRHITDAGHRRCIRGTAFGVRGRIPAEGRRPLGVNHSGSHRAFHLRGIFAAIETFTAHRAALDVFRKGLRGLVEGMITAERVGSLALLVSGITDGLGVN